MRNMWACKWRFSLVSTGILLIFTTYSSTSALRALSAPQYWERLNCQYLEHGPCSRELITVVMCFNEDDLALGTDTSDAQIPDTVFTFLVPWALSWWDFILPHSLSPTLHQHWCSLSDSRSLFSYDSMFPDVSSNLISTSMVKFPSL